MLIKPVNHLYVYVVARDFGFAPNPFHGYCTLATCKPDIRRVAKVGDWVMGVGGTRLHATGQCVYLMKVTEITTFDKYWTDPRFGFKKALRNGSLLMMVGDNIYHKGRTSETWIQEDSHHSNPDGTPNTKNVMTDTSSEKVLISTHFYYFGRKAPRIDLSSIGYSNIRNYRKMALDATGVGAIIEAIESRYGRDRNTAIADPFDFKNAAKRVDQESGRVS
jgi:hypothetical protein